MSGVGIYQNAIHIEDHAAHVGITLIGIIHGPVVHCRCRWHSGNLTSDLKQINYNSAMNVILFDIDGTLMLTDRAGQRAMEQVVPAGSGSRQASGDVGYAGRTDRSIVADHLRRLGLEDTDENFLQYTQQFLQRLPDSLAAREGFVLPGVIETLERLSACASTYLGLLTGNLRQAAKMKLSHFQLDVFFQATGDFVGGFGDEHHDRDDVARVALAEARRHFVEELDPQDVWIVGDTPRMYSALEPSEPMCWRFRRGAIPKRNSRTPSPI